MLPHFLQHKSRPNVSCGFYFGCVLECGVAITNHILPWLRDGAHAGPVQCNRSAVRDP